MFFVSEIISAILQILLFIAITRRVSVNIRQKNVSSKIFPRKFETFL